MLNDHFRCEPLQWKDRLRQARHNLGPESAGRIFADYPPLRAARRSTDSINANTGDYDVAVKPRAKDGKLGLEKERGLSLPGQVSLNEITEECNARFRYRRP